VTHGSAPAPSPMPVVSLGNEGPHDGYPPRQASRPSRAWPVSFAGTLATMCWVNTAFAAGSCRAQRQSEWQPPDAAHYTETVAIRSGAPPSLGGPRMTMSAVCAGSNSDHGSPR
jgi:hypothetical protein